MTSKTGGTKDEGGGAVEDSSGAEKEGEKVGRANDPDEPIGNVVLPAEARRGGLGNHVSCLVQHQPWHLGFDKVFLPSY